MRKRYRISIESSQQKHAKIRMGALSSFKTGKLGEDQGALCIWEERGIKLDTGLSLTDCLRGGKSCQAIVLGTNEVQRFRMSF
jgi:hypothetical protein